MRRLRLVRRRCRLLLNDLAILAVSSHLSFDSIGRGGLGWYVGRGRVQLGLGKPALEVGDANSQVGVELEGQLAGKGNLFAAELLILLL